MQVQDGTAREMAAKIGLPWRPDLMRAKDAAGLHYQRQIGEAYLREGLDRYPGDTRRALMFYHGGPNERLWGPKTRAYADNVLRRLGGENGL